MLLLTFLKKNRKKKVMVFMSSCLSVKYHNELFNYIDLPVHCIHVSLKQSIFTARLLLTVIFVLFTGQAKADKANNNILSVLQC